MTILVGLRRRPRQHQPMRRVLLLLLVICGSAGCQSDCEEVCETSKDCGYVNDRFLNVSCSDACSVSEDLSAGCEAEFDAYYGCLADAIDGCTATHSCEAETKAYEACLGD